MGYKPVKFNTAGTYDIVADAHSVVAMHHMVEQGDVPRGKKKATTGVNTRLTRGGVDFGPAAKKRKKKK